MTRKNKRILIVIFVFALCFTFALLAACQGGKQSGSGESAKSAYQQYIEKYPDYEGTEEEWLKDLLDGKLNSKDAETKKYTVSFMYDESDEEPWAQITVEDGDTPIFPGAPEKRGYQFIAWGYQGYEWPFAYPIRQDTVLTPIWKVVEYGIKYNLNGGVNSQYNVLTYTIERSFDLQAPTRDYYDFGGWYTSSDFAENSIITGVTLGEKAEDIEIWAKWTPTSYDIEYAGIEGTTIDAPLSYNIESVDITLPQPERDYYVFDGWTGNGTTKPEKTLTITSGSHGDLKYTANWTAITYKITYDLGGGTNSDDAIYEYTIESFENDDHLPLPTPEKAASERIKNYTLRLDNNFDIEYAFAEFTFGGWYKEDDLERIRRYEYLQITDGDVNLVAYWTENEGSIQKKTSEYCRLGDVVLIGSYPQSEVTDDETLAGLAEFEFDLQPLFASASGNVTVVEGWTDSNENYWYKDVEYNGKKYRGVFIVRKRSGGGYRQEQAGYVPLYLDAGTNKQVKFYWFNYDPIRWSVVDEGNGEAFLVCKTRLETMKFGHDKWESSTIRYYLNDDIYSIAFNDAQKKTVLTSTVANDAKSMGYDTGFASSPTEDKLFLLSYEELNLYKSKFVGGVGTSSYCVATLSKGATWTRSHCRYQQNSDSRILAFDVSGEILGANPEYSELGQILPAMRISLK